LKIGEGPDHRYYSDVLFEALSKIKPAEMIIRIDGNIF
jgi:hypothetical protein